MWSLLSLVAYFFFLFIVSLFLIKFYEGVCVACIRDTKTRKAIKNKLTIWQSLSLLLFNHDQPLPDKLFQISKSFHFEPFIFYMKGFIPTVVFSDNHAAKTILIEKWKNFEKNTQLLNPFQKSFIGNALVFMNGEEWHANRSVLNPSFQHVEKYWQPMCETICKCISNMEWYGSLQDVSSEKKSYKIKIKDMLTRLTLDVIGLSALDSDFKYLEPVEMNRIDKYEQVLQAFRYLFQHVNSWERNLGLFGTVYSMLPIEDNLKMEQAMNTLNSFIYSLIEEKREKFITGKKATTPQEDQITSITEQVMGTTPRERSAIENLLWKYYECEKASETHSKDQVMNKISFRNLRDDILLLFIAGHATTAEALGFLLFQLAQHSEIQDRLVHDELKKCFIGEKFCKNSWKAPHECDILINSMDDIHRMNEELPYLDAVVNESLRLIPPLGMLNRLTCSDEGNKHSFQLVNGLKIPKNYSVSLSIKAIHCNPEIWGEDCERFVPERWIQMKQPPMTMPSSSSYGTTSPSSVHSPTGISPAIELPQTSEIFNMGESIPPMTKKEEKLIPTEDEKQRNQSLVQQQTPTSASAASSMIPPSEKLPHSHHPMICSYLPFGAGARVCLGQKFSLQEQKLFVIHLLSKYQVSLDNKKEGASEKPRMKLLGNTPIFSLSDDTKLIFTERPIEIPLEYHLYEEDFDKQHITEGKSVGDTGVGLNADEEIPSTSREYHPLDIIHQVDNYQ